MKNNIDFTTITACGECCAGCKKKEDGICQGCIESDGIVWNGRNPMAVQFINAQENIMFNFVDCAKNFPVSGSFKKLFGEKT